jgi:hypothetical protein
VGSQRASVVSLCAQKSCVVKDLTCINAAAAECFMMRFVTDDAAQKTDYRNNPENTKKPFDNNYLLL